MLTNSARNNMARKSGFSSIQWVIGQTCGEGEVARIGAQAASETPGARFFRKSQLRMAAIGEASNKALRRAELRRVRPTGPFPCGLLRFLLRPAGNSGQSFELERSGSCCWP